MELKIYNFFSKKFDYFFLFTLILSIILHFFVILIFNLEYYKPPPKLDTSKVRFVKIVELPKNLRNIKIGTKTKIPKGNTLNTNKKESEKKQKTKKVSNKKTKISLPDKKIEKKSNKHSSKINYPKREKKMIYSKPHTKSKTRKKRKKRKRTQLSPEYNVDFDKLSSLDTQSEEEISKFFGTQQGESNFTGKMELDVKDFAFVYYLDKIKKKIKSNWLPPPQLTSKELKTVVYFRILRDGSVDVLQIEKSSNNPIMDEAALRAIKASIPFPPLPVEFGDDYLGVHFEFSMAK